MFYQDGDARDNRELKIPEPGMRTRTLELSLCRARLVEGVISPV